MAMSHYNDLLTDLSSTVRITYTSMLSAVTESADFTTCIDDVGLSPMACNVTESGSTLKGHIFSECLFQCNQHSELPVA